MAVNWQDVITAVGGQAGFLLAAAWLTKKIVSQRMLLEAEEFKTKLKGDADAQIERLKNTLQMTALEHQIRFSRLHERRAEVIAELYKLLVEAPSTAQRFIFTHTRDHSQAERTHGKVLELYRFVELNRLYLPIPVCVLLDNFVKNLRHTVIQVDVYWTRIENPTAETIKQQNEVMLAACTALETELPALRKELENEFRALLGVAGPVAPSLTVM